MTTTNNHERYQHFLSSLFNSNIEGNFHNSIEMYQVQTKFFPLFLMRRETKSLSPKACIWVNF